MSDEDGDIDIESDEDEYEDGLKSDLSTGTLNGEQFMTVAEKRAHHNALERKRRDHIKESFHSLRDCVPVVHGEKVSRAQILKKTADYISFMRRKNTTHQKDIDDIKKQNVQLENEIRYLEKIQSAGQFANQVSGSLNQKGGSISAFDGGSGSESSDEFLNKNSRSKKLKTSM